MTADLDSASVNEVLQALSDERRRILCDCMTTATKSRFDVEELAARAASREGRLVGDGRLDGRRAEIAVALRHQHLPRLDDAGLVDYDSDDGTVRWLDGDSASFVETVLEELDGR